MYFPDLSPYTYWRPDSDAIDPPGATVLNVGWLEFSEEFTSGEFPLALLEKLLLLITTPVNRTRGFQSCTFCPYVPMLRCMSVIVRGREYPLGTAEIRVPSLGGIRYAAPTLIYHYIKVHQYLPPQEFIDALNTLDLGRL